MAVMPERKIKMETTKAKLMKPLFDGMNFNCTGKRMRAVFEREVSNGEVTYKLWHKAGQYDHYYPCANNDGYLLYVEKDGYLLPLRMTDFFLINHSGYASAIKELYGSEDEKKNQYRNLQNKDDEYVRNFLNREQEVITKFGNDSVLQATYIQSILEKHIKTYIESKENGGETFPDFVGAAMLGELEMCKELSRHYKEIYEMKMNVRIAAAREKQRNEIAEKNKIASDKVQQAIQIIRSKGTVKNDEVTFYNDSGIGQTYHMFNYLMRYYGIEVPLRTQGWINKKLVEVTAKDGGCSLQFYKSKNSKCSQTFFDYMYLLIDKIQNGDE